MITEEQRKERVNYLGSSDSPAVLGISRWKTPLAIWAEKTGQIVPEDISDHLPVKLGNRMEQIVAELFTEKTGFKVRRVNETFYHPRHKFLASNIDRRVVGSDAILECKTCSPWKAKEWADEEIPAEYVAQVMHQLMVTGYKEAHLAVLIGNEDFKVKLVQRHDGVISQMEQKLVHFWNTFVIPKVMPSQIMAGDKDTLGELFPTETPDLEIIDHELDALVDSRMAMLVDLGNLQGLIDKIENEIRAKIRDAVSAKTARHLITWKAQKRKGIDTKLLMAEMPDVYNKYLTETAFRVLRIKALKEPQ